MLSLSPLPMANIDVPLSQNIPHRHLVRSGVARGDDADEVIIGDA